MMSEILLAVGAPILAVATAGLSVVFLPPESGLARDLGLADRAGPSADGLTELPRPRRVSGLDGQIREAA